MRLTAAQVRAGLYHPDKEVRTAALAYFTGSSSPDPAVMPAVIQAVERYGWEEAFSYSRDLARLAQTDETLAWVIDRLTRHPPAESSPFDPLVAVLLEANPALLRRHEPRVLAVPALDREAREVVRERVALLAAPAEEQWRRLQEACAALDRLEEYPRAAARLPADAAAAALAAHPEFAAGRALAALRGEVGDPESWLEVYAVRIVRHLRLAEAVPLLVDRLHEDVDALLEEVHPALAAIGSDAAVERIVAEWPAADWTFRFMAACVLEDLHTDRSVAAALALAPEEPDRGVRSRLYEAAVRNFAPEAVEPARQFLLRAPADMDTNQLRDSLLTACALMGERFPEFPTWLAHAKANRAAVARRSAAFEREEDDEPPPPPPGTVVREGPAVGRNDPCPCGSGRKFKKCCGANR
jgi:hypothetical protein